MSVKLAQIIKKDFTQSVAGAFTRKFASGLRERLFYDTSDSYTPSLGDSITFLQPVVSEISDDPKLRRSFTSSVYRVLEVGSDSNGSPFFRTDRAVRYNNPEQPWVQDELDLDPTLSRIMYVQGIVIAEDAGQTFPSISNVSLNSTGSNTATYQQYIRTRDVVSNVVYNTAPHGGAPLQTSYRTEVHLPIATIEYKQRDAGGGNEGAWIEIEGNPLKRYHSELVSEKSANYISEAIERQQPISWNTSDNQPLVSGKEYKYRIRNTFPTLITSAGSPETHLSNETDWLSPPSIAALQPITVSAVLRYDEASDGSAASYMSLTPATNPNAYSKLVSHQYQYKLSTDSAWENIDARQPIFNSDGTSFFSTDPTDEYEFRAITTARPLLGLTPSIVTGVATTAATIDSLGKTFTVGGATILSAGFDSRQSTNLVRVEFQPPLDGIASTFHLETSPAGDNDWTRRSSVSGSPDQLIQRFNKNWDYPKPPPYAPSNPMYARLNQPSWYKPNEQPPQPEGTPEGWWDLSRTERNAWIARRNDYTAILAPRRSGSTSSRPFVLTFNALSPNTVYDIRIVSTNETVLSDERTPKVIAGVPEGAFSDSSNSATFEFDPSSIAASESNTAAVPPSDVSITYTNTYQVNVSWVNSNESSSNIITLYYRTVFNNGTYGDWQLYDQFDSTVESVTNLNIPRGFKYQIKVEATQTSEVINETTGQTVVSSDSQFTLSDVFESPVLSAPTLFDYNIVGDDLVFTWVNSQVNHSNNIFKYRSQSTPVWTEVTLAANSTTYTLQNVVTERSYVFSVNGIRFYNTGEVLNARSVYRSEFSFSSPVHSFEIWADADDDLYMTYERDDKTFGWGFGPAPIASGMSSTSNLGTSTGNVQILEMSQDELSIDDAYFFRIQARSGNMYANTSKSSVPLATGFYWGQHKRFGYYANSSTYINELSTQGNGAYTHLISINNAYPFINGSAIPVGGYWSGHSSSPPVLNEIIPEDWLIGPKVEIPEFSDNGIPLDFPDDQGIYPVKIKSQSSPSYTAIVDVSGTAEGFFRASTIASLSGYQSPTSGVIDQNAWTWGPKIEIPTLRVLKDLI